MSTRIGAVVAIGVMVIAAGLALVLGHSKPRQAGSNYVPEVGEVLTFKGNGSRCQPEQVIPADTGGVRLLVGTYGRPLPELRVTVGAGDRTLTSGRLPAGGREGHVIVPLDPVDRLRDGTTVCVEVAGSERGSRTVLYGAADQLRFEWVRPGSESWFDVLPTVAHRFGLGRALPDGWWVLVLAGLLLAAAWVLAMRLTLRELGR